MVDMDIIVYQIMKRLKGNKVSKYPNSASNEPLVTTSESILTLKIGALT